MNVLAKSETYGHMMKQSRMKYCIKKLIGVKSRLTDKFIKKRTDSNGNVRREHKNKYSDIRSLYGQLVFRHDSAMLSKQLHTTVMTKVIQKKAKIRRNLLLRHALYFFSVYN